MAQTFSEEQMQAALSAQEAKLQENLKAGIAEAVRKYREKAQAEFAEQQRQAAEKAMRKSVLDRISALVTGGKIPPALTEGIAAFAENLPIAAVIEFAEGQKKTPAEFFADYMEKLFGKEPFAHLFAEQATKEKAAGKSGKTQDEEDEELGKSIAEKLIPKEKGFPKKGGK